jgi:hypothetical protein
MEGVTRKVFSFSPPSSRIMTGSGCPSIVIFGVALPLTSDGISSGWTVSKNELETQMPVSAKCVGINVYPSLVASSSNCQVINSIAGITVPPGNGLITSSIGSIGSTT